VGIRSPWRKLLQGRFPIGGSSPAGSADRKDLTPTYDRALRLNLSYTTLWDVVVRVLRAHVEPATFDPKLSCHLVQVLDRIGRADEVPGIVAVEGQGSRTTILVGTGIISNLAPWNRSFRSPSLVSMN
jgi:hypothetical protein